MITLSYILMTLLMISGLFLIGLILLQRGRGGGLAGAFGGMGGQSAFGTKAGDVFTRITIGVATAWILLCAGNVIALHHAGDTRTDQSIFKKDVVKDGAVEAGADVIKAPAKDDGEPDAGDKAPAPPAGGKKEPADDANKADVKNEAAEKPADPAKAQDPGNPVEPGKPAEPEKQGEEKPADAPKTDAVPPAADKPADPKPPEAPADKKLE